jgi:hypothetical protein
LDRITIFWRRFDYGQITHTQHRQQAFYLYNRVETIERKVEELQMLVPDAKIGFAHGQMTEVQLENTLMDFIDGDKTLVHHVPFHVRLLRGLRQDSSPLHMFGSDNDFLAALRRTAFWGKTQRTVETAAITS